MSLDSIIREYLSLAASEENARRRGQMPGMVVGIEEPMCYIRLFDLDYGRFLSDAEYFVEQTLRFRMWRFENIKDSYVLTEDLIAIKSLYPEYTLLGMDVTFDSAGVPLIAENHPLRQNADLSLIEPVDFHTSGWMKSLIQWYEDIKAVVGGRLTVHFQTWWRACLDLAIDMRGYETLMADAYDDPDFLHGLLSAIIDRRIAWFDGYYKHFGLGRSPASIADDWINIPFITPGFFEEFLLPMYKRIEDYHGGIIGIHSCGNQTPVHKMMQENLKTIPVFEISPWSSLEGSLEILTPNKHITLGFHPNDVLIKDTAAIEEQVRHIHKATKGRKFSLATSGLTLTPPLETEKQFLDQIGLWLDITKSVFWK